MSGSLSGVGLYALSTASATYFDVIVSGPAGPVVTALHMHLEGNRSASQGPTNEISRSTVQISFSVDDVNVGGGFQVIEGINGAPPAVRGSGALTNFGLAANVTSDPFNVQVGVPFKLAVVLMANAEVAGVLADSFDIAANTDFSNTLSFATGGPVFELPAGYTADSIEAGIVDNEFQPVPEPSPPILLGVGAILLLARARRRLASARSPRLPS
jgi:hypothetical protein